MLRQITKFTRTSRRSACTVRRHAIGCDVRLTAAAQKSAFGDGVPTLTWKSSKRIGSCRLRRRRRMQGAHRSDVALVNEQRLYSVSLIAAHLLLLPSFNDGACFFVGVNWHCLVVVDASEHICAWLATRAALPSARRQSQFVQFRTQLFEPDMESLWRHMALLQKNAQQHNLVWWVGGGQG